jgi:TRAP transporter TAXI family solute receptor
MAMHTGADYSRNGHMALKTRVSGRWWFLLVVSAILTFVTFAAGPGTATSPPPSKRVRIAMMGVGRFGPLFQKELPDIEFTVKETLGSPANLDALERGATDITFSNSDIAYRAFTKGTETNPHPYRNLRGVVVLSYSALHLIVGPGFEFRTVTDLRNKKIGIPQSANATEFTVHLVCSYFGIDRSELQLEWLSVEELHRRLQDRTLDAIFDFARYEVETITAALRVPGARLVPIQGPAIDKLREDYPFLRPVVIPAATYGQRVDVQTIGVDRIVVCHRNVSEDVVYRILTTFFDSVPEWVDVYPALRTLRFDDAAGTPIPLHPGAARFYRERELFR